MPYQLQGRNVLVTGGSRGLGAVICEKFAAEGCNVAVNYNESKDRAQQVANKVANDHSVRAITIQGDVGIVEHCERIVQETIKGLGGIDIIISNAGWTKITPFASLTALTDAEWHKSFSTNTTPPLHLLRAALPTFTANPSGGVLITTSSIAGVSAAGSSMGYAVSKAAGLHLVKCLAATQGPTVRVNAVLPGLLLTEWGERFGEERIEGLKQASYLKTETDLEDTANMYPTIAKNTSMTGQFVQIDSGLAMLGRTVY